MNIVPLLFMMTMISVFATGILMLLLLTKRNRLQLTLAGILGLFLLQMVVGLVNMSRSSDHLYNVLSSPLQFRFLALGLVAFFAAMTYYMVAAHRNLLTLRGGILFLSPVLLTLAVYVLWHLGAGVPMDYPYASLREVWENRFTVPVILRVLMFLFFLIYQGIMFWNMWHLDALRGKYSILNSPDAVSNIRWLRMVVVGIMAILFVYSLLLFIPSLLVLTIYSVVMTSVFIYFIYNALARPMYEDTEEWQAVWTPRDGWKIIEGTSNPKSNETVVPSNPPETIEPLPSPEEENTSDKPIEEVNSVALINRWMEKEKPFCRIDFSTADIINHFPNLDAAKLNELLSTENGSRQAYVRRHRIEEACRIIDREKEVKVSDLALRVGFSHTSSFSRAFAAVMNQTVVQYINKAKETT